MRTRWLAVLAARESVARWLWRLMLLAGCLACLPAAAEPLHITQAQMLRVPSAAFEPVADRVDVNALAGPWARVDLPHSFFGLPRPGGADPRQSAVVTTWYRIDLADLPRSRDTTHFYLLRWQVAGQLAVYADGELLYRSRGTPLWNVFRHPPVYLPLNQTADAPLPRTLLIRMDALRTTNGAISSAWVGDSSDLYWRYAKREWLEYQLPFMSSAAFLALAFFSLAVWAVRRHERIYLLFFFTALCQVVRRFHFYADLEQSPLPDVWFGWLTIGALVWQVTVLHFFFHHLHRQRQPVSNAIILALAITCTIFTLPVPAFAPSMVHVRQYLFFGVIVCSVAIVTLGWIRSVRAGVREGVLVAIGYGVGVAAGIFDYFKQNTDLIPMESFFLTPYAAVGLFMIYTYVMYRRYIGAIGEVEQVNAGLEARLAARERELSESYARLREVEQREMLSQERRRLMQDMHDGLGSSLMSALRVVEHGKVDEAGVAEVLKTCVDDLKLTIDSMEPVEADLLLLLATLRFRLGPRLENTGVNLRWEVKDVPALPWLDPRNALHILRILQEAFTNVIKHTRASEISVATEVKNEGVLVTIADNGGGFDVAQGLARGGKGMGNQQRRAESIGAKVAWQADAVGTTFTLWLPFAAPAVQQMAA